MAKEIGQAFGGIGDAVSGVMKGIGDAVDGAVKGVGTLAKQIYDSDIGKAIIIAGAVYFGGAALAGGFGTMGTSASFLSGMGAGVSSAATSLSSAWSLAAAGEFGSAAGTIGSSWGTAYGAGAQLAPAAVQGATALSAAQAPMTGQYPASSSLAPPPAAPTAALGTPPPVAATPGASTVGNYSLGNATVPQITQAGANLPAATQPWYAQAMDYITPKSELAQYGLISGATSIGGNILAGIGQDQAAKEQREYEEKQLRDAQALRNANVGAELFAPGQYAAAPGPAPAPAGLARRYMPQVAPGSPGYVPGQQFAQAYNRLPPGMGLGQYTMRG